MTPLIRWQGILMCIGPKKWEKREDSALTVKSSHIPPTQARKLDAIPWYDLDGPSQINGLPFAGHWGDMRTAPKLLQAERMVLI